MNGELKLAVIGGGSSYTPELIEGILQRKGHLPIKKICLMDIPEGQQKLEIIGALSRRMAKRLGADLEIETTLDRRRALDGADFVVAQIRVGGLEARALDEEIPLRYGMIGQETTGPGGFANALRTIPVMLSVCRDMEELSPEGWLINFTNPSGIITEAILNHTKIRALGLCNIPICMRMDIAKLLDVSPERIDADFCGLNHMNYVTSVYLDGRDILPRLIDMYAENREEFRERLIQISDIVWDDYFIRTLGMITSPYHRYFYANGMMLREEMDHFARLGSRAKQVRAIEDELFALYADPSLEEKPEALSKRGGAFYSEAAISLIDAIYNNLGQVHTVNLRNNGAISDLRHDDVIESNALVGNSGAVPLTVGALPMKISGLIQAVKAFERLTVKAGVSRRYEDAYMALVSHPLVHDYAAAKKMLDEMIAAHPEHLGDITAL